ncbi:hypothetical protein D3C84_698190 [compost metagenome]
MRVPAHMVYLAHCQTVGMGTDLVVRQKVAALAHHNLIVVKRPERGDVSVLPTLHVAVAVAP